MTDLRETCQRLLECHARLRGHFRGGGGDE